MTAPMMLHVEPRRPKRRKWPWRVLWGMLAIVVGTSGYWWWSCETALRERDALLAELRAKGEPVFWNETADKLLAERSPETGAELFLSTLRTLKAASDGTLLMVPSKLLLVDLDKERFDPKIRPDVQQELKLAEPAIAILEQAVKRSPGLLTTALKTDDPVSILLPHIQDARNLSRLLHFGANDALARGDAKKAYRMVRLAFLSAEQLAKEPLLIPQLVRLAMRASACDTMTMCLAYAAPSDEDFRAIDELLAKVEGGFDLSPAWNAERAMWMTILDDPKLLKGYFTWGTAPMPSMNGFQSFMRERWCEIIASPIGRPATLRTQSAYLRLTQKMASQLERPDLDREARGKLLDEFDRDAPLTNMGLNVGDWGLRSSYTVDDACTKAHRRNILARLALRLRRHFDKHGKFPEKLDELCDQTMPKIRTEWFQGKGIVYSHSKSGFRLEVPDALLSQKDVERKKQVAKEPSEFAIEVEIK